jgi:predicted secreted protein
MLIALVFVVAISLLILSLVPRTASLEVTCDDFTSQGGTISKEVELGRFSDLLVVTLCSNATTGFEWELVEISDENILEPTEQEYVAPEGTEVEGAAGQEIWTFKILRPGEAIISMEYSRPWEGGEKGEWTFDLSVKVK